MSMLETLPHLSSHGAKVFLVLVSQLDKSQKAPLARVPMAVLSHYAALSPRACSRAIRELKDLQLLRVLPHGYHKPPVYLLLLSPDARKSNSNCSPPQATAMPPGPASVGLFHRESLNDTLPTGPNLTLRATAS